MKQESSPKLLDLYRIANLTIRERWLSELPCFLCLSIASVSGHSLPVLHINAKTAQKTTARKAAAQSLDIETCLVGKLEAGITHGLLHHVLSFRAAIFLETFESETPPSWMPHHYRVIFRG